MAEFCLDCWNKLMNRNDPPQKYRISRELELCEECGQLKPVIICERKSYRIFEWNKIFFRKRREKE